MSQSYIVAIPALAAAIAVLVVQKLYLQQLTPGVFGTLAIGTALVVFVGTAVLWHYSPAPDYTGIPTDPSAGSWGWSNAGD